MHRYWLLTSATLSPFPAAPDFHPEENYVPEVEPIRGAHSGAAGIKSGWSCDLGDPIRANLRP